MKKKKLANGSHCVEFDDAKVLQALCGQHDQHLRAIERHLGVELSARGDRVFIRGEQYVVALVDNALRQLYGLVKRDYPLYVDDVIRGVDMVAANDKIRLADIFLDTVIIQASTRRIAPKSATQKAYIEAIREQDVVFGVGPAGTGKTYLAMAVAIQSLLNKQVKRIVLTRPAVEAGEKLGFLPGDLVEKVNPYLRPLYDALHDMMELDQAYRLIQRGHIEIAPLAFMRGRTLNDSFVILDEAQNATRQQMKMLLTRLGFGSKAVITGDITQVDLPIDQGSGLIHSLRVLEDIDGIDIIRFGRADVVRHPLVQKIIDAYEQTEQSEGSGREERERRRAQTIAKATRALDRDRH